MSGTLTTSSSNRKRTSTELTLPTIPEALQSPFKLQQKQHQCHQYKKSNIKGSKGTCY